MQRLKLLRMLRPTAERINAIEEKIPALESLLRDLAVDLKKAPEEMTLSA